ncbi:ribonuclease P protein component [Leptospira sp. GIMC2001]|nr:ribonuclease P protein component [Leptospira sp. GIMC2001]WCL51406.1 ribonuclease P protein component [Leptospira sp. GIMC2001]
MTDTLRNRTRIRDLFKKSKKISQFPITVLYTNNQLGHTELLYCSDRSSRRAVDRNRTKRILRAISFENEKNFPNGFDIAVIANKAIEKLEFPDRVQLLAKALRKMEK